MQQSSAPHILVLPFPAEGHIKPMFNLANLVCYKGQRVTFVNSHHYHARLHKFTDLTAFHTQFQFASITDGIPQDHPRLGTLDDVFLQISPACRSLVAVEFRELFLTFLHKNSQWQPPSCIIADGLMSTIAMAVAQEFHVPLIIFRTYSATCTWVTIHLSKLIHNGVPVAHQHGDNDKLLTSIIPGLENLLRDCDLPSIFKLEPGSLILDFYVKETIAMTQASALILNTFDELEAPIVTKLATIFPKVYTIGPLHTLLNNQDGQLRKEDRSCITWLDHQKAKSVLYVSFGTVVKVSHEQLLEFWFGLVNSLKPFLWVIRSDLLIGGENLGHNNVPLEVQLGTKERGFIVDWAPQVEVLAHYAVGGFLTHSGWNSTLECIAEGVPMLCWPQFADQTVNSRCVSEGWRIGLDMNGTCDRFIVEKMVRDLMENRIEELTKSANDIAEKARNSVKENGSSCHNLENLIKDIRSMKVRD